jgi:type IV secretion system protein VirB9
MRVFVTVLFLAALATVPVIGQGIRGPVRSPDGSHRYAYDGSIPTIPVGVGDSCDIEFEAGETIRRVFLSDTLRWKLADGVSDASNIPHLVVKPTATKLATTLTVLTDRRSYHIRLVSTPDRQAEYVRFTYPSKTAPPSPRAVDRAKLDTAIAATYTCQGLDIAYVSGGANEFRNVQICNDGRHTYINAPEWQGDLPMPYTLDNGVDEIANYSYDPTHRQFIIDGVPTKLVLIRGSGRRQLRTTFEREPS